MENLFRGLFDNELTALINVTDFLLCIGVSLVIGLLMKIKWMTAISLGYLAILWIPFSPEKIVTTAIALFLVRRLFPKHNRELEAQILEAVPPKQPRRKNPRRKKDNEEI